MPEWDDIDESLDGISAEQLSEWRERAVPEPAGAIVGSAELTNDLRLDIPTTVICTAYSSEQYREAVKAGYSFVGGLAHLKNVTFVDLPTSHWPMWSLPVELADLIVTAVEE